MALACPPDDVVAAHVSGALSPDAAAALGDHLDGCASCRDTVIALVRARGTPADAAPIGEASSLPRGATIGRYRLERLLGAGGMGMVYAAHDPALERTVALKILRPDLVGDAAALAARLVRESRLMARVTDPAVIAVHDVGRDGDRVYLAMELIDGVTLGAWLARRPRTLAEVIAVFRRAGSGLAAAHQAGLIHRDFKPDNVLIAPADADPPARVVVTDLGVARAAATVEPATAGTAIAATLDLTATGVAIGTPAYMAPEQLDGATVDARADLFAFGVTLWEALHGTRPFAGRTPAELRAAIARGVGDAPAPRVRGRIPARLRQLLRALLAADPTARPPTMGAVLDQLTAVAAVRRPLRGFAAVTSVVAVAAVVALLSTRGVTRSHDPCAAPRAHLARAWSPSTRAALDAALVQTGADAATIERALARLGQRADGLGTALDQQCHGPVAPSRIACLEARQVELDAVVAEVATLTPSTVASLPMLVASIHDPAACAAPGVSLLEPRWPRDAALRRSVAAVRHRFVAIEAQRDRAEFAAAVAATVALDPTVAAIDWEPLVAEHLYLLGTTQSQGTDPAIGVETLRRAAATAERAHHDYIAASAWTQLVVSATMDERDPVRGLEYAAYAGAASARLGRPPPIEAHLAYARGTAKIEHEELAAGEADLRAGLALAEADAPELVGMLIQGLAFAFENQGRYSDAVATYRRALDRLDDDRLRGTPSEVIYRGRLAANLAQIGDAAAAVDEGRLAAILADRILDEQHPDRAIAHINLGEALRVAGSFAAALDELRIARRLVAASTGERSETFGDVLVIEAGLLADLGDPAEAAILVERACEILAFRAGDDSLKAATCRIDAAWVLSTTGRYRDALAHVRAALPIMEAQLGPDHGHVANAYTMLGEVELELGDRRAAAAAFEESRQRMSRSSIDPAYLAAAEWGLAHAIVHNEPARARVLVEQAAARWRVAPASWAQQLADAETWLRRH